MFAYRTVRVQEDLAIAMYADRPKQRACQRPNCLIGMQLRAFLQAAGHEVVRLVRPSTTSFPTPPTSPAWSGTTKQEVPKAAWKGSIPSSILQGGIGDVECQARC